MMARHILTPEEYIIYEEYSPSPTSGGQIPFRDLIRGIDPVLYMEQEQNELREKEVQRLKLRKDRLLLVKINREFKWPKEVTQSHLQPTYACDLKEHQQYCQHPGLCFEERLYKYTLKFYNERK